MGVGAEGQEKNSRGYRKDRRKQKRAPNNRGKGAEKRAEQNKATLLEMVRYYNFFFYPLTWYSHGTFLLLWLDWLMCNFSLFL